MRIHLLHTNDVHSQLENFMRAGAALRRLRNEVRRNGEWALTFDVGDVLDRVRPETEATHGMVNAALMDALGYDGWVFGNNEGLTIPVAQWPNLVSRSGTVAFGTNLRAPGGAPLPFLRDWAIFERSGVRVGVFGLTPDYRTSYQRLGVDVDAPHGAARRAVDALRAAGCDVIVLLSHLGLGADRRLAEQVPGVDVILGGHTHHFMEGAERVGETYIFQPGKHAQVFGHTVIDFDPALRRVRGVHGEPVPVRPHDPLDAAMLSAYRGYLPDVRAELERPVATLPERLPVAFDRESPFANLLVDALFDRYPSDLGVMMSGALTASLLPGVVRVKHALGACATPTRPVRLTLRGKDIRDWLAQSVQPEIHGRPGFGFGFRGGVIGWFAIAGAQVTLSRTPGSERMEIRDIRVGAEPLADDRDYRVITCEYLWLTPVFNLFRRARDAEIQVPLAREVLVEKLADATLQRRAFMRRWRGAPGGAGWPESEVRA
ncbi:bifunctional UDP-sugar hydrolase/5'-nucleotidase [Alicyclobacillus sp.]|uniref:bifunctional metallophosphatase/5'-nucleotidase n=1 Tax=Alicyclobacillus sp. TaxID=61169 RepID=UPI0025B9894E|nr:bifunctional UDP-sugar hydrolase/5'-nucleotidase [Alicyclobacillus sp.]MCL6517124.1 bifunctional metallophosphatase/5'-nucleotidase [Alicyclobacillus sp.]